MKLTVATPFAIIAEACDVAHLRAEDETGAFGILPGHADFLTALSISVATWRDENGDAQRLYLAAIRQICRFLKSEREPPVPLGVGATFNDGLEQ